jgi:hypothetical protein
MLEKERQYYDSRLEQWLGQIPGRFVVITGDELVGIFDTMEEALAAGARRRGLAPFLVRRIQPAQEEVRIPALTWGLLNANITHSVSGSGTGSGR